MSPWTVYFLASASILFPINFYFKTRYGEKKILATLFLSLFWFIIPIMLYFNIIGVINKIETFIKEKKNDS